MACSSSDDTAIPDNNGGNGNDTDNGNNPDTSSFDRSAMLANWADEIIVPGLAEFEEKAITLQNFSGSLFTEPTVENLELIRQAWLEAYKSFQLISMFELGPAEEERLRARVNTYPTDTEEILDILTSSASYDLELPSNIDIQGFPAIDFMLYGLADTPEDIVDIYANDPNAIRYVTFLTDLTSAIENLAIRVHANWVGSFADEFKQNDDASASGSIDKLTNDYIFYYEKALRAGKIGIPAGVFSTDPLPQNVEAFYNQEVSKTLALAALQATQDFFNGKSVSGSGLTDGDGFKDYLDALGVQGSDGPLSNQINDQFDAARAAINQLNDNFVIQIQTNNTAMLQAYDELQRNVILLKVDMLQALGIDVDFVDTDGD